MLYLSSGVPRAGLLAVPVIRLSSLSPAARTSSASPLGVTGANCCNAVSPAARRRAPAITGLSIGPCLLSPPLHMTTLSGILEMPPGSEGRIRQFDDGLVENNGDPFVPLELSERYSLRQGQRLTVQVVERKPKRRRGHKPRHSRPVVESVVQIE